MSIRASVVTGFIALSVSGCVSDPYYGYGSYGPVYGGYYAGSAIIYDKGPSVLYRPHYVQPRSYPPYRTQTAQGLRYAHPPYSHARQPANDVRRLYRR